MKKLLLTLVCVLSAGLWAENYAVRFCGQNGGENTKVPLTDKLSFSAVFGERALVLRFSGAADGTYKVQIRPGVRNDEDVASPIAFAYETATRKLTNLCPARNTAATRRVTPSVGGVPSKKDAPFTALTFSVPFREYLAFAPFAKVGKRPVSWRVAIAYTAPDGKTATWGTPEDPNFFSWTKGPDAAKAQEFFFMDPGFKNAWGDARWWACGMNDRGGKEKWIGYLDPGVETFQWRNAASEKLFVLRRAEKTLRVYEPFLELLSFKESGEDASRPAILRASQADRDAYFKKLPGLLHAKDEFIRERRAYLLDRFLGRESPELPPREQFKGPRKAPKVLGRAKAAALDDDGPSLSLDDDDL